MESTIVTPESLNTYSGKTLDANMAQYAATGANQYVGSETHRLWGTTAEVTETYDWGASLWLNNADIQSISQIVLGWPGMGEQEVLQPSSYFFDKYGRVTLFWQQLAHSVPTMYRHDYLAITYTYGNATVPADLVEAAHGVALNIYNWIAAGGNQVVSAAAGSLHLEYSAAVRGANVGPTPYKDVAEQHYRTILSHAIRRI